MPNGHVTHRDASPHRWIGTTSTVHERSWDTRVISGCWTEVDWRPNLHNTITWINVGNVHFFKPHICWNVLGLKFLLYGVKNGYPALKPTHLWSLLGVSVELAVFVLVLGWDFHHLCTNWLLEHDVPPCSSPLYAVHNPINLHTGVQKWQQTILFLLTQFVG